MSTQIALFDAGDGKRKRKSKAPAKLDEVVSAWFDVAKFVANFGTLVECHGGIAKLRQGVLDLAVRGKLSGSGWQAMAKSSIALYEIPVGWRWITLGEVVSRSDYGTSQKAHKEPKGVAVLRMNNIQAGRLELSSLKYVPASTDNLSALTLADGDLLFNRTNSYELVGKMAVFRQPGEYTFASYLIRVRLQDTALPEYVNAYFGTLICRQTQIEPQVTRQTNQANFNGTKLKEVAIPLPPLAEQKRIVAKVDELMALIDELEAKQTKKRELGARLTKSALDALTSAEGPAEFDAAWKRVVENFDVIVDRSEKVAEVRGAIRDLAVSGHLVPPSKDSRDEQRTADEGPFVIPRRWRWVSLGELASETAYGTSQKAHEEPLGVAVIRMNNIQVRAHNDREACRVDARPRRPTVQSDKQL
jgi:hypothetical protein